MKISRLQLIAILLIAGLVLVSGAAQGQDTPPPQGTPENYRGTLAAVGAADLTLTDSESGQSVTIAVNSATQIKIPKMKNPTLADLPLNSQLVVQALRAEDGSLTARRIHLVPGKPAKTHRVGIIVELSETSLTIQNDEGETFTFAITPDTRIIRKNVENALAVGVKVTVIAPREPGMESVATGIVVHGPQDEDGEEKQDKDKGNGQGHGRGKGKLRDFRVGLIMDLSETSITIQNDEGETFTYAITAETWISYKNHKAELKVGSTARVTLAPGQSDPPTASAIEVHGPEDEDEEEEDD